jgi:hypothetical protein
MDINRHGPRLMPINCQHLDTPYFLLPTSFRISCKRWTLNITLFFEKVACSICKMHATPLVFCKGTERSVNWRRRPSMTLIWIENYTYNVHYILTINVPLIWKCGKLFFCGQFDLWAISRDILRGPRLFWPLNCPERSKGQFRGQKSWGPLKISREMAHKLICPNTKK